MSFISAGIAAAGLAAQLGGSLLSNKGGGDPNSGMFEQMGSKSMARKEAMQAKTAEILRDSKVLEPGGPYDKARANDAVFQGQSDALTGGNLHRYDNFSGQLAGRAKTLGDYFTAKSSGLPAGGPTAGAMPASGSAHTDAYTADALAKVAAFNSQQGNALGQVRAFGDLWGDIDRSNATDRQGLANVSNFRMGDRALLPMDVELAKGAAIVPELPTDLMFPVEGAPDNTFADILQGVGKVGTTVGLSGYNPFGGGFSGTPAGLSAYGSPGYAGSPLFGGPR